VQAADNADIVRYASAKARFSPLATHAKLDYHAFGSFAGVERDRCSRHSRSGSSLQPTRPAVSGRTWMELTCKFDDCTILINAAWRPGISMPSLMRRIRRMGLISAPTCSKSARIKSGLSEGTKRFRATNEDAIQSIATSLPTNRRPLALWRNLWPARSALQ